MQLVRLIQIGDIHFPTTARQTRLVDDKDNAFPALVRDSISASPLKTSISAIHSIMRKEAVHALCFVGDFTDIGEVKHYDDCARYISECLTNENDGRGNRPTIVVVPGNHDVNRTLARSNSPVAKFKPLQEILKKYSLPVFSIDKPDKFPISAASCKSTIVALNSCWGCGAKTEQPHALTDAIDRAIVRQLKASDSTANAKRDEKLLRSYYNDQIDTPAFPMSAVRQIVTILDSIPTSNMPILIAHHNLLPQRLPRIARYTEVLNSGQIRDALLSTNRDCVYLHGHTHDPTFECVSGEGKHKIILIGSPLITAGFNIVEVVFSTAAVPVGVRIIPWRRSASGILGPSKPVKITLAGGALAARERHLDKLYGMLLQSAQPIYMNDLFELTKKERLKLDSVQIRNCLELLEFDGKAEIANLSDDESAWMIRAVR